MEKAIISLSLACGLFFGIVHVHASPEANAKEIHHTKMCELWLDDPTSVVVNGYYSKRIFVNRCIKKFEKGIAKAPTDSWILKAYK